MFGIFLARCEKGISTCTLTGGTYLQVLSLSSSWRSLQCSSVCLQEHRQVSGSCTNKRFLLSWQWLQHGSQRLDRDRQTDRQTEGGGEEEGERQIITVYNYRLEEKAALGSTLSFAPVCSPKPKCDKLYCMWQSGSIAHRFPPSRQTSKQ